MTVPVPEMDTEGVDAAESVNRAVPVRAPLPVAPLDSVAVALMLAVADTVKLLVAVGAAEREPKAVADLPAVEVTDTEPVADTDSVPVGEVEEVVDTEPDTQ